MRYSLGIFAASAAAAAVRGVPAPGPDGKYTLEAEGIKAKFVPFAASLSNLWVKDKNGVERDIVGGFDNASQYPLDPGPVYNGIPGRYTNRIGKGTFSIDNVTYSVTPLNNGPNLLHSGLNGWHTRSWNVSKVTKRSITFKLHDPANSTGMPGRVEAVLTYTLSKNTWNIEIDALSPEAKTPIQLTQHTYFQLDSYTRPNRTIWNHTLHMPSARRVLAINNDALPNGTVVKIPKNDIDDFWSAPKQLGHATGNANFKDHCGGGCNGYNTNWAFDDRRDKSKVAATLSSEWSGIKAELKTNQDAIVLYTCWWNDGKTEYKSTQGIEGATDRGIPSSGAIAIEAQDWVDGINHPEWGRLDKQIFGPGDKYRWTASWSFSTLDKKYGN